MAIIAGLHLTEQEQTALEIMAQRLGKTPDELVHDAVRQLLAQFQDEDRLHLLRQARDMWKDRTDLPALADLRREIEAPLVEHGWLKGNPADFDPELPLSTKDPVRVMQWVKYC